MRREGINLVSKYFPTARCDPQRQFTCNSGRCIDILQKCDGNDDCADASDEASCPGNGGGGGNEGESSCCLINGLSLPFTCCGWSTT